MGIAKEFKVTGTRRDVLCFRGEKKFHSTGSIWDRLKGIPNRRLKSH